MTDNELLILVKAAIGISGTALDTRLLQLLKAIKGLMENYGIETEEIESDAGVQCLALGVQDMLNAGPGEVSISPATRMFMDQLHHVSLEEVVE